MSFENDNYLARQYQVSSIDLDSKVDELLDLAVPPTSKNRELYREMMLTVARMAEDDRNRWDAKIMMQTLREMEASFSLLERFKPQSDCIWFCAH